MIKVTTKNNTKFVTSSYFDDLRVVKQSQYDTDMRDLRRNSNVDTYKLQLAYVAQQMILSKKGVEELSKYARDLSKSEINNVITVYPKYITDQKNDETAE